MLTAPGGVSLEDALSSAPDDVRRDLSEHVASGRTDLARLEQALGCFLSALSRLGLPVDARLGISRHLGDVTVTSRLAWVVAGMHPCLASWLDDDAFLVGPAESEVLFFVPPLDLGPAAGEVYAALRRDGTPPGRAADLARLASG